MATFRSQELPSTDDLAALRREMRKQIDLVFAVLMEEVESDRTDRLVELSDRFLRERNDALHVNRTLEARIEEVRALAWGYQEAAELLDASLLTVLGRGNLSEADRVHLENAHARYQDDTAKLADTDGVLVE